MRKFFANFCAISGWVIIILFTLGALSFFIREPNRFIAGIEGAIAALFILDSIGVGLIFLGKYLKKKDVAIKEKEVVLIDSNTKEITRNTTAKKGSLLIVVKTIGIIVLKSVISLIVPAFGTLMIYNCFHYGFYFDFAMYIAIYLIWTVFNIYIIWRNKPLDISDILFLPLFQKIGLHKRGSEYQIRKRLFVFMWILILMLGIPTYYLHGYYNGYNRYSGYEWRNEYLENYYNISNFIFTLPIILLFLYLAFTYGKQWIDDAKEEKSSAVDK